MYSERTQVLLSPDQLRRIKRLAHQEQRSVGAVIRDAVDAYTGASIDERRAAFDRLTSLEAPIDDWVVMKAEILAAFGGTGQAPEEAPEEAPDAAPPSQRGER